MSNTRETELTDQFEQLNEALAESVERNVEAQTKLMDTLTTSFFEAIPEEDGLADGVEGYANATEVWLEASEQALEETTNAIEGGGVEPSVFRDIWLRAANEAASELMGTDAFAAADGSAVGSVTERQQELRALAEDSLAQAGMATQSDVREVAQRLVELERRQHAVERKLDEILEAVE